MRLEQTKDLRARDGANLGNAVGVTKDHTDLPPDQQARTPHKTGAWTES